MRPQLPPPLLVLPCFNPRICKRCDFHQLQSQNPLYVSIHASVKDATVPASFERYNLYVSIHASVKDATPNICFIWDERLGFNPRICKRCDCYRKMRPRIAWCFNPRICKRCDKINKLLSRLTSSFNPRICKRCDW